MIQMRPFVKEDVPALQSAIDRDKIHPDQWRVEHFHNPTPQAGYNPPVAAEVIEDDKGPVSFVRFTKTLRISVVWNDSDDAARNARAVIFGIKTAVEKARGSGFSEIIITTSHPKLAMFLNRVMRMTKSGDEFLLAV